jgi:hypothetical protein
MKDKIVTIPDTLQLEFCQEVIRLFESVDKEVIEFDWGADYKCFEQILYSDEAFKDTTFAETLAGITKTCIDAYRDNLKSGLFPKNYTLEVPTIRKYDSNNKDQFGLHSDVGNVQSGTRFLSIQFYLNDVDSGGETVIEVPSSDDCITIVPRRGLCLLHPPFWMYPVREEKILNGAKYVINTFAHYED